MSWRVTALKMVAVWTPMAVAFNDLVVGFVPVAGDTYGIKQNHPKFIDKSWVMVNKWAGTRLRRGEIEPEDLVVLVDPVDQQKRIIRKVKALDDTWVRVNDGVESYHVYVRKGYVWLDGRETTMEEEKDEDKALRAIKSKHDSVTFGAVSLGLIIGKPILVVRPFSRLGAISTWH